MTTETRLKKVARFKSLAAIVAAVPKPFDPMRLANQVLAIWKGLNDA